MTKSVLAALITVVLSLSASGLAAHCEIPCGIYGDATRITLIREHIDTIEKSMKMIGSLSKEEEIDYNQLVRWIDNKESHAEKIQYIVTQYFMTQRIKPSGEAYVEKLKALHHMLLASMKAKQTLDMEYVQELRTLVDRFEKLYFKE